AAIIPPALIKALPAEVPDEVKDFLAKLSALSGGITLTDGIKLQITLATKEAADAKALKEQIDDGMNKAVGILALLAGQNKELAPLLDFIKSVKVSSANKSVTLKGELTGEALNKLIPKDQ